MNDRRDHLDALLTHRMVSLDEIKNHGAALLNLAHVQRTVRSFEMDDFEVEEWIEALES